MSTIRGGLVALLAVAACGDRALDESAASASGSSGASSGATANTASATTATGASTGEDTADVTTGGDVEACACSTFEGEASQDRGCDYELLEDEVAGCPVESLCPEVTVGCEDPSADIYDCRPNLVFAEGPLRCSLEALRDRKSGVLHVEDDEDMGIYTVQRKYAFRVFEEGEVILNSCQQTDASVWYEPATRISIGSAEYFQDCLDMPSPATQYACLWDGIEASGTDLPSCG